MLQNFAYHVCRPHIEFDVFYEIKNQTNKTTIAKTNNKNNNTVP